MSEEAIARLMEQFAAQTTDRMVLIVGFLVVLAFIIDRGLVYLRARAESADSVKLIGVLTQLTNQNQALHKSNEMAAERNDKTINAQTQAVNALVALVKALDGRQTDQLTSQQRLEELLTEGETSTSKRLEKKMDEKIDPVTKRLDEIERKQDETLRLLKQALHIEETPADPPPAPPLSETEVEVEADAV